MAPQLYITMYKEQFTSPCGAKRAQLRPTSAHRRNNPQPRPDFLFPRSLQPTYRSSQTMDIGRPLFPPVKQLSFHNPFRTDNSLNTVDTTKVQHMPPVNTSTAHVLPSADGLHTLQLTETPAGTGTQLYAAWKNPPRMDYQRNAHPLSAQQHRQYAGPHLRARPQTSNLLASQHHLPRAQYRMSRSNTVLDYSGCYSCFHVVKPYQAGHYIIHPEFVSECLR
ncbi:uncharacterized protein LOC122864312 [Scomber scombrus]|uniref:Uncharacterized protein LOC122864312 n=1 Tax=Scomber scombrus TaxID=13677 RepID=A0AAV1NFD9_SCOSC